VGQIIYMYIYMLRRRPVAWIWNFCIDEPLALDEPVAAVKIPSGRAWLRARRMSCSYNRRHLRGQGPQLAAERYHYLAYP
jgi:hypothetical protein